ncbi:hypothetical protein NC651_025306 [Populus alba x Populus x berolinensis]|nr:hypothetical protein NC651_025306 [Populus alba x Populus x berolinensis]
MGFNCVGSAWKAAPLLGLWLACVLMTLNATGINNCSIQALAGLGCTNRTYYTFRISKVDCKNIFNTWNIVSLISWKAVDECRPGSSLLLGRNLAVDLAYLLQKHSVSFSHYTITLGANPNYFTRNNCLRILCNWMCYFKRHEEKALIYSHSWLEDVILPGLAGGTSGYAGEGDPFYPLSSLSIRSHKNGL